MSFSVGVLYSIQDFLELVKMTPFKASDFPKFYRSFGVASSNQILKTAIANQWVDLSLTDELSISVKGKEILNMEHPEERLRVQLFHLIALHKPSWSSVICYGRGEAVKYFKSDVYQCFEEAGLLEDYSDDVVKWWDRLGSISRNLNDDFLLDIGRIGERLSIEFERKRTGNEPIWQSIDSSFSGYDLLSIQAANNPNSLMIEVKASKQDSRCINFHISKNEWDVATASKDKYVFHIWSLNPIQQLFVLNYYEISHHIPDNKGSGKWESVLISLDKEFLSENQIIR
ncbi:DUF3883 domain-containing protein [Fictibacillus sp. 5RED26]|uniref:DUF3883 domain-containing protein n=1 Tax=Fictibacillus sp. 5RED26 TaxID=2745876 RepID=UPI0018CDA6A2|nr:DUF3883 domain-containing protein [Fictibacillus sp. 5RED26]MBH0158666.1 DUF3883 domain-containing protein [Fictibacillus sp. 5RED26]